MKLLYFSGGFSVLLFWVSAVYFVYLKPEPIGSQVKPCVARQDVSRLLFISELQLSRLAYWIFVHVPHNCTNKCLYYIRCLFPRIIFMILYGVHSFPFISTDSRFEMINSEGEWQNNNWGFFFFFSFAWVIYVVWRLLLWLILYQTEALRQEYTNID